MVPRSAWISRSGHVFRTGTRADVPLDEEQRRGDAADEADENAEPHPTRRMARESQKKRHQ